MTDKKAIQDSIIKQGILPLFYNDSPEVSIVITQKLYEAGIRVIEYTNRGGAAIANFKALKKLDLPGLLLGIGTIKSAQEAETFEEAGADFLISPLVNHKVAAVAKQHNLLWIPGCMTPSEMYEAQELGATLVKLFPANVLGPGFVSAVKDLFPGLLMMPTGGVEMNQENISSWFKAGVSAVGMGSKLITKDVIDNEAYDQLYTETLRALQMVASAR
ncbi:MULTISPECIES: bifunctional 4-hydroxy-2-oxoglutarate aldolase/2-dehydro-3-deoxy-phosphogluconate aldolase [unclassified Mucilaginibacter]|uniref:bifunctional 4-hydroxy-2-oxoglutarate aldolase/2-dehydro-3-deoxy-phosphogluconate aldolase n=1 Tax=unclassified Mucilaginibacter TaxID=2617802 RepID=UPI002AC91CD1|nr:MULTISPECIES: bifunctional 4-hydroxy-2-oxoglutarate aldolase/2-dehydro-3-deoxy-phosphogluconate aldolase [unclassified Mucilaginibacter]MEB0260553.1 bifunctional 4-hydroxy-2-oxoglutarate aldolase/2-dehydro-3-deoxy-phosphogluconate aldolase [Mucilaginibacter sp. 10I4]MEB0278091.1 bifunctional 4-hydroxy-2-oxoglutarate aldolase/2-dehydro-3-deoxy-phosphogluconate aldolase [Mucilaginibacter sp. 10B2]MEB0301749.1 bifunctional 4-hydroxy-2-oxoglutarate aldolase/2-dehydro-3-deoxy-phosphogluconate aldo